MSKRLPPSIRYNNPGAMYPGPSAEKFGTIGTEIIGGGHKIAVFPTKVYGAAALFHLLETQYTNRTVAEAIKKWSGGNYVKSYLAMLSQKGDIEPDEKITVEKVRDPEWAIRFAKAMAWHEAGREYLLSDERWEEAHALYRGEGAGDVDYDEDDETGSDPELDEAPVENADLSWIAKARSYLGTKEISGSRHNPIVVALWELGKVDLDVDDDETPWCAAFVSAVLEEAGIRSARTGWARSYANWGRRLRGPAYGCVVVFTRRSGGHVGFCVGKSPDGYLLILGGNQHNSVSIAKYSRRRVIAYRWPNGVHPPDQVGMSKLPLIED